MPFHCYSCQCVFLFFFWREKRKRRAEGRGREKKEEGEREGGQKVMVFWVLKTADSFTVFVNSSS